MSIIHQTGMSDFWRTCQRFGAIKVNVLPVHTMLRRWIV